jgi:hypothetical protein
VQRQLVVEGEAVAAVADLDQPTLDVDPAHPVGVGDRAPGAGVGGLERVEREHVLDVHQQQLLVLLLVVEAQLDGVGELVERAVVEAGHQVTHPGVDVAAVEAHVVGPGPADHAPLGSGVARPDGLVVAVEEEPVVVLERREPLLVVGQDEGLEEPGDMGAVPLGRRHVGHRLDRLVLGRERRREALGVGPDLVVGRDEGIRGPGGVGHGWNLLVPRLGTPTDTPGSGARRDGPSPASGPPSRRPSQRYTPLGGLRWSRGSRTAAGRTRPG